MSERVKVIKWEARLIAPNPEDNIYTLARTAYEAEQDARWNCLGADEELWVVYPVERWEEVE